MSHHVLYDPERLLGEEVPLDRAPHLSLVQAVLAWTDGAELRASDLAQIALQLTGHARVVATDVQRHSAALPKDSKMRALADVVLAETGRRLSAPSQPTVACCKHRARLVQALYERLDQLGSAAREPAAATSPLTA